jgi:uncharacterized cupredoxin-like copper-binding protein
MSIRLLRALPLAAVGVAIAACAGGSSPSAAPATVAPTTSAAASAEAPSTSTEPSADASADASGATGDAVTVTAVEYEFQGAPATTDAGTSFALTNGGQELHELVLVRKNDDVTESFEEILQLPDEEAFQKVGIVGQLMAEPGTDAEGTLTAQEPGDYLMICFVPVGMTELPEASGPDASIPAGEPHFTRGMLEEFTVEG